MAENLNYAYMPDTLSFCYNNSANYCAEYGRLYTWAAAMDSLTTGCGYGTMCSPTYPVRGVCPEGWHLPDTAEWELLKTFVADSLFGGKVDSVGYALKSAIGWFENLSDRNCNGSDALDFRGLPAGYRESGKFKEKLFYAYFWSSSKISEADSAYSLRLSFILPGFDSYSSTTKDFAQSVRCVKD